MPDKRKLTPLVITAELHNWIQLPYAEVEVMQIEGYIHNDTRKLYADGEYVKLALKYPMSEYEDHFIAKTIGGSVYKLPKDKKYS